jgi:phosphoribosyl 1,2-cyclic phosphate phosphodiesterase
LIDLGPDILMASALHNRPLTRVRYCLQTHGHADHLDASHFISRSPEFGVIGAPKLHFYASAATAQRAAYILDRNFAPSSLFDDKIGERLNLKIHLIEPLQSFSIGAYDVVAFSANHDPSMESLLYAVTAGGFTIFYGTDTAGLSEETWQAFHQHQLEFDLVILDHTYGPGQEAGDHLNAAQFIEHVSRMREEGLLADRARILATHIAHEGNMVHPELVEYAAEHGYEIAYDGLSIQIPDPTEIIRSTTFLP